MIAGLEIPNFGEIRAGAVEADRTRFSSPSGLRLDP
jgi:hypothetical protein